MLESIPPQFATFLAAELFLLLTRTRDIQALVKKQEQRSEQEKQQIERGLLRSLLLEIIVFVPASALLLILIEPVIIPVSWKCDDSHQLAFYSLLGLISYGFPFATIRGLVTRIALITLRDFDSLSKGPKE